MPPARAGSTELAVVVHDGDPRRVVAAVLQPSQPLDEDLDRVFGSDVTDDAAHMDPLPRPAEFTRLTSTFEPEYRAGSPFFAIGRWPGGEKGYFPFFRLTQPAMFFCRLRATASGSGGDVLRSPWSPRRRRRPSPTLTGATSCVLLPMKTFLPHDGRELVLAVVVAGDGARADVAPRVRSRRRPGTSGGWPCCPCRGASSSARRSCRPASRSRGSNPVGCGRTGRSRHRCRSWSRAARSGP